MLPEKFMLPDEFIPDERDQKEFKICVAFAITAVMQVQHYKMTGEWKQFSPTFAGAVWKDPINKNMKSLVPETALKYAEELGCCFTDDLPELMQNPEAFNYVHAHPELFEKAKKHRIEGHEIFNHGSRKKRIEAIKTALFESLYPIVITVKDNPEDHCVPVIGWDNNVEKFYVMNSWGNGIDTYKYEDVQRGYHVKMAEEFIEAEENNMENSQLVDYVKISPYKNSPRNHAIDTITIHCYVGQASVEDMGREFQSEREHSCNYGVAYDGKIALIVDEGDRSWCSSSRENDHRAITIEVACEPTHPYEVNDKAYNALIELIVDICKRNNIKKLLWKGDKSLIGQVDKQNMTVHRWFANKACPGEWLYERHEEIADMVNKRLSEDKFTDIKDHWARDVINEAAEEGIVNGRGDGTFCPDEYITRAEAVKMIMEALKK